MAASIVPSLVAVETSLSRYRPHHSRARRCAPSLFGGSAFPAFFDAFLMALDNESEPGAPVKRTLRTRASQKWCGGSFFALRAGSLHPLEILSCCRCFAASALRPAVISFGVIVLPWALSAVPPVGPLTCALSMVAIYGRQTKRKCDQFLQANDFQGIIFATSFRQRQQFGTKKVPGAFARCIVDRRLAK